MLFNSFTGYITIYNIIVLSSKLFITPFKTVHDCTICTERNLHRRVIWKSNCKNDIVKNE